MYLLYIFKSHRQRTKLRLRKKILECALIKIFRQYQCQMSKVIWCQQSLKKEIQVYTFGLRKSTSLIDNLRTSRKNKGLQLNKSIHLP